MNSTQPNYSSANSRTATGLQRGSQQAPGPGLLTVMERIALAMPTVVHNGRVVAGTAAMPFAIGVLSLHHGQPALAAVLILTGLGLMASHIICCNFYPFRAEWRPR